MIRRNGYTSRCLYCSKDGIKHHPTSQCTYCGKINNIGYSKILLTWKGLLYTIYVKQDENTVIVLADENNWQRITLEFIPSEREDDPFPERINLDDPRESHFYDRNHMQVGEKKSPLSWHIIEVSQIFEFVPD